MQGQIGFNRVLEKVLEKAWKAVQSQVCRVPEKLRFNTVLEKVPEKFSGRFQQALVQSQVKFNRIPEKFLRRCGRLSRKTESSSMGLGRSCGEGPAVRAHTARRGVIRPIVLFLSLVEDVARPIGCAARIRKISQIKPCNCGGYHRSVF